MEIKHRKYELVYCQFHEEEVIPNMCECNRCECSQKETCYKCHLRHHHLGYDSDESSGDNNITSPPSPSNEVLTVNQG